MLRVQIIKMTKIFVGYVGYVINAYILLITRLILKL